MDWFDLFVTVLVFVPLERLLPKEPQQKIFRGDWLNDVVYLLFNSWFIRLGLMLVVVLVTLASDRLVPQSFRLTVAEQLGWVQLMEIILLSDLGFYTVHRLFHAVPFLWRFHAVHHSIEKMDWLAGYRVHPIDQILTKGASLLPCFALGFSTWAIGASFVLYHWHSLLLHSNVRINFGPIRWLIASPNFHHWHHSKETEAQNKNFAGQLAILDILFRTAHMPAGRWTPSYGVREPVPRTYVNQILYPFSHKFDSVLQRPKSAQTAKTN